MEERKKKKKRKNAFWPEQFSLANQKKKLKVI